MSTDELEIVSKDLKLGSAHEIELSQTKSLETLANAMQGIAGELSRFLNGGGLTEVLSGYARSQSVQGILSGLATHMGRGSLDAKTIKQNALEITELIEAVFDKYAMRLAEKNGRDPNIKEPSEG